MSLFSDRRPISKIGGLKAYMQQVAWSVWWRRAEKRADRLRLTREVAATRLDRRTKNAA